jgi:hypothetical protein
MKMKCVIAHVIMHVITDGSTDEDNDAPPPIRRRPNENGTLLSFICSPVHRSPCCTDLSESESEDDYDNHLAIDQVQELRDFEDIFGHGNQREPQQKQVAKKQAPLVEPGSPHHIRYITQSASHFSRILLYLQLC